MQPSEVARPARSQSLTRARRGAFALVGDGQTWFTVSQLLCVAVVVSYIAAGASLSAGVLMLFAAATVATAVEFAVDPSGWRKRGIRSR